MVGSLRSMINHAGDTSNLILDDDLDSYYLMDITLRKLPSIQQQQGDIAWQVGGWLRDGQVAANKIQVAVMLVILRQEALDYVAQRDVQATLNEDRNFNGLSPSLQTNLPPAAEKFRAANAALVSLLDRIVDGQPVAVAELKPRPGTPTRKVCASGKPARMNWTGCSTRVCRPSGPAGCNTF